MTDVEALEVISSVLSGRRTMTVTETEYEPPYAGIWVTMADGSRWIVRIEPQTTEGVTDERP